MRDPSNRTRMLVRWTRESGENPGHGRNPSQDLQSAHLRLQARGRIPKVAVFLKYCFPCGKSPRAVKTGHWKGCHGPERRLKQCVCVKERILYAWMDQSEDLQKTEQSQSQPDCSFGISSHRSNDFTVIAFFHLFSSLLWTALRRKASSPAKGDSYRAHDRSLKNGSYHGQACS